MAARYPIGLFPSRLRKWSPFFFICYLASSAVMVSVMSLPLGSRIRGTSSAKRPYSNYGRLYDSVSSNDEHKMSRKKKTKEKATTKTGVKKTTKRKYAENSVVTRIAKASALRNADRELKESNARQQSQSMSSRASQPRLGSLTSLTAAIDKQLIGRSSTGPGLRNSLGRPRLLSDSSMTSVVQYNSQQEFLDNISPDASLSLMNRRHIDVLKHVAVVFARPLIENQITVEYASRIRRLVKAIKFEDYNPDLVCFVETETARGIGFAQQSKLPSSSAGYLFFRHLCAAQAVSLQKNLEVYIQGVDHPRSPSAKNSLEHDDNEFESSSRDDVAHDPEYLALLAVTDVMDHSYLPEWRQEAKRLRVKVSLVSSDYHICQIHDVQQRSPNQSTLRALNTVLKPSNTTVETKWSFMYTTTAPILSKDKVQGFFYKCYITAQQLYPVVVNLRGVANNREFFQRENYLSLVSARRSLVTDMERIYNVQPSLKSVHHLSIHSGSRFDESHVEKKKPVDVVLESALLSLGRCCDLVRPAGLLTGSVTSADWKLAYSILEQAVDQIVMTCDPDKPLEPLEWGHLMEETTVNVQGEETVQEDEGQDSFN